MEAPEDDELEWMAMEQLHVQEYGRLHDELDELDGLDGPLEEPDESTALNDVPSPVKRKKLVFPDPINILTKETETRTSVSVKRRKLVFCDVDLGTTGAEVAEEHIISEETAERTVVEEAVVVEDDADTNRPHKRAADIAGDFIPITSPSGERVYAELQRNPFSENVAQARREGQLLSVSVEKIIEELERQQLEQIVAEKTSEAASSVSLDRSGKLWVDKYAPGSFTELLSHEQINREVLSWLKQWDSCVFGAKRHSTPSEALLALRKRSQRLNDSKNNKRPVPSLLAETKLVADDRPIQKVLLLCGPPGLGKTTLAHVAARHCGYRVVEINASDDRTSTSLQKKILDAIQMRPVTGDKRPNCLIIDEIDGACTGTEGKSAIGFLLELINAESSSKKSEEGTSKPKRRSKVPHLSRPIICICNDLYAPALRPLRQVARIHVFSSPSPHRIVTRLKSICKVEGYKATDRSLTALAVHTESDIRSCLNTLQFLHQKGHRLNLLDIGSQVIGRKDMTSSMFDIWNEIFSQRRLKATANRNRDHEEFSRLHELFTSHGEHELGMDGIFENFLSVRYHDVYLQKTIKCLDLLTQSDIFGRRTASQKQFFMNLYRPSINLGIRRLIAQPIRPRLEWPTSSHRCRQLHAANLEHLKSWLHTMTPVVVQSLNWLSLVQDVLSPLLSILAPNIRPVASNLLSQQERDDVKQLIDTMIGYGVRYKKAKTDLSLTEQRIGFEAFSLDPPLFSFINYKAYSHKHPQLSLALQQMLCHEVEMECIKRETAKRSAAVAKENLTVSNASTISKSTTTIQSKTVSVTTKTVTTVRKVAKAPTSFFDRFRTRKDDHVTSESSTAKRDSRPLLFKFHEGFTNAVKKPVLMRDLL